MSIVYYAHDHPLPIRGVDISNALIELLTITRWGALDFLIIDLPRYRGCNPGCNQSSKKIQFLVVATQFKVVMETV